MAARVLTADSVCTRIREHVYPAHEQLFRGVYNAMHVWLLNSAPKLLTVARAQDCRDIEPLRKRPRLAARADAAAGPAAAEEAQQAPLVPRLTAALVIAAKSAPPRPKTSSKAPLAKAKKAKQPPQQPHTRTHASKAAQTPARLQSAFGATLPAVQVITPVVHKPPPRSAVKNPPVSAVKKPAVAVAAGIAAATTATVAIAAQEATKTKGATPKAGPKGSSASKACPSSGKKQRMKICPLCSQAFLESELEAHIMSLACYPRVVTPTNSKTHPNPQPPTQVKQPPPTQPKPAPPKNTFQQKLAMVMAEDGAPTPERTATNPQTPFQAVVPPAAATTPTQSAMKAALSSSQRYAAGAAALTGSGSKRTPQRSPAAAVLVGSATKRSVHLVLKSPTPKKAPKPATPHKSPGVPIWEYHDSDDSDYESPSESEQRKKYHPPSWARGAKLQAALAAQEHVNPDTIFRCSTTVDLEKIFGEHHARPFRRRTSSANWKADHTTWTDRLKYNQAMGFTTQQQQQQQQQYQHQLLQQQQL